MFAPINDLASIADKMLAGHPYARAAEDILRDVRVSKSRRTFEDLGAAAEIYRPVQDRLVYSIAIAQVRPSVRNPRHRLAGLDELADSLQEYGLLQPVVVRRVEGGYELIAGHCRVAAARQLGWTEIAVVVRDETDNQAYLLTLTENLQREDLSPKEEAKRLRSWSVNVAGPRARSAKRSSVAISDQMGRIAA